MAKILGICASARKESTYYALEKALEAVRAEGVEAALLELRGKKIAPCIGCNLCVKQNHLGCVIYHDDMDPLFTDFDNYDGYLIATPVFDMSIPPLLCSYFSRFRSNYLVAKNNRDFYLFKPGAAIAVGGTRNGGQESAIKTIHNFYNTNGIPIVNGGLGIYGGASVWSRDEGRRGAQEDEIGIANAMEIGRKLAKVVLAFQAANK